PLDRCTGTTPSRLPPPDPISAVPAAAEVNALRGVLGARLLRCRPPVYGDCSVSGAGADVLRRADSAPSPWRHSTLSMLKKLLERQCAVVFLVVCSVDEGDGALLNLLS